MNAFQVCFRNAKRLCIIEHLSGLLFQHFRIQSFHSRAGPAYYGVLLSLAGLIYSVHEEWVHLEHFSSSLLGYFQGILFERRKCLLFKSLSTVAKPIRGWSCLLCSLIYFEQSHLYQEWVHFERFLRSLLLFPGYTS